MQANLRAHNAWFYDVAHHDDDNIEQNEPNGIAVVAHKPRNNGPRNQNTASAQNWQDVKDGHKETNKHGVWHLEEKKAYGQFQKGHRKNNGIRGDVFFDGFFHIGEGGFGGFALVLWNHFFTKINDAVKIRHHEKRCYNGNDHLEEEAWNHGEGVGQNAHALHRILGNRKAHILHGIAKHGIELAGQGWINAARKGIELFVAHPKGWYNLAFIKGRNACNHIARLLHQGYAKVDQKITAQKIK